MVPCYPLIGHINIASAGSAVMAREVSRPV